MEETPHLVAHFMATGAEKRLEDYCFLRNTYETITNQEIQLNRILRMLGEDEFSLNWRSCLLPIGRGRSRSLYEFDRWSNTLVLKGNIAYERLRELEQDPSKHTTVPTSSRRVQELRERRQRYSEQRELPSGSSTSRSTRAASSSRLLALAEYDTALAESEAKRKRKAEENRLNTSKDEEKDLTERRRERYKLTFDDNDNKKFDDNNSNKRSKQQDDESSNRLTKYTSSNKDQENDTGKIRKSSNEYVSNKSGDIELISFIVRCQPIPLSNNEEEEEGGEKKFSVRLLCQWASPSSSSAINHFTIEQQVNGNDWLPVGEKINKLDNKTQLDISSTNNNENIPSYFRLKAHLQNGQTFTSKSTDGIYLNLFQEKNVIKPDVEILSASSVQLTWNDKKDEDITNENNQEENIKNEDNENEDVQNQSNEKKNDQNEDVQNQSNEKKNDQNEDVKSEEKPVLYDIEKKEEEQGEWEKVTEVPLSQRSARIDSLTDANQCQFRLIPATPSESEETAKLKNQLESEKPTESETETTPEKSKTEVDFEEITKPTSEVKSTKSENEAEPEESIRTAREAKSAKATKAETTFKSEEPVEEETEAKSAKTTKSQATVKPEESVEEETEAKYTKTTKSKIEVVPEETGEEETEVEAEAEAEVEPEPEESTEAENEVESDLLTVNNVNEWLNSLTIKPASPTTVDVDISEEGFKEFDCYKVEYTLADQFGQWKKVSDITSDNPHLTVDKLKQGTDYKFRFTPISSDSTSTNETSSSTLSVVLDVKTPSTRKGRFTTDESETPVSTSTPQFTIQKLDPTSVLIEAVVPDEEPATFEDVYDVYSKKEKVDDDWTKVGTIDKENLSTTVEDLEENTAYAFKIDNTTSPSGDDENATVQEFKFDTTPVKKYDPSTFLEKIEQSLENVVNGVMQAAAGHHVLEEPVNKSLNEVIKEVFRDETLVPNEEYGFDTLELNKDLQVYRGPKQMLLKELEVDETIDVSEHEGEIIIHNYRTSQQSVIVREENGNTRVGNIDGDIIIRNVVSDVLLKNERTNHQLSMNIVGQAFLRGVQGSLIASKFKGIIVVKNVHKP